MFSDIAHLLCLIMAKPDGSLCFNQNSIVINIVIETWFYVTSCISTERSSKLEVLSSYLPLCFIMPFITKSMPFDSLFFSCTCIYLYFHPL
jgi:hypothetical protein